MQGLDLRSLYSSSMGIGYTLYPTPVHTLCPMPVYTLYDISYTLCQCTPYTLSRLQRTEAERGVRYEGDAQLPADVPRGLLLRPPTQQRELHLRRGQRHLRLREIPARRGPRVQGLELWLGFQAFIGHLRARGPGFRVYNSCSGSRHSPDTCAVRVLGSYFRVQSLRV